MSNMNYENMNYEKVNCRSSVRELRADLVCICPPVLLTIQYIGAGFETRFHGFKPRFQTLTSFKPVLNSSEVPYRALFPMFPRRAGSHCWNWHAKLRCTPVSTRTSAATRRRRICARMGDIGCGGSSSRLRRVDGYVRYAGGDGCDIKQ